MQLNHYRNKPVGTSRLDPITTNHHKNYFQTNLLQVTKHPTVCQQPCGIYISTHLLTSQKYRWASHIVRVSDPPQRNARLERSLLGRVLHIMISQLSSDGPRHQSIASDPILAQRNGHGLHHGKHSGLSGRVVGLEASTDQRADGGDTDDGAAMALLDHLPGSCLAGVEAAFDVDVDAVVEKRRLDPGYVSDHFSVVHYRIIDSLEKFSLFEHACVGDKNI